MAAPIGNKFWQLRSKHGRDKLFADSNLLWEAACEYFEWCDQTPLYKPEQRKGNIIIPKDADISLDDLKAMLNPIVDIPTPRPYTLHGLCLYLGCNTAYFRTFKAQSKDKTDDFNTVITHIEEVIYSQKFEGAAAGIFNANIISRDLGLKDSSDITTGGDKLTHTPTPPVQIVIKRRSEIGEQGTNNQGANTK